MSKFLGGLICGWTLLALLGASEAGFRFDWKGQLAQKENQQVINDYLQMHCQILGARSYIDSEGRTQTIEPSLSCHAWDEK
jgi:hypothetical protein